MDNIPFKELEKVNQTTGKKTRPKTAGARGYLK